MITSGKWETGWGEGITGSRCAPQCYLEDTGTAAIPIRSGKHVVAWILESIGADGTNPKPTKGMEDDSRLIAAAPDLLEACKAMIGVAGCGCEWCDKAKAAIAKAEGRA